MLYPRQPHMHVCLFYASALPFHKSTYTNTHSRKLECVRPHIPSECASLGVRRGKGAERARDREKCEGVRGSRESSPTHFSLVHSLHLASFPPFLELCKESLSPASQLQSSSVQLCHCMCKCMCV